MTFEEAELKNKQRELCNSRKIEYDYEKELKLILDNIPFIIANGEDTVRVMTGFMHSEYGKELRRTMKNQGYTIYYSKGYNYFNFSKTESLLKTIIANIAALFSVMSDYDGIYG